jgi:hypothetical protein
MENNFPHHVERNFALAARNEIFFLADRDHIHGIGSPEQGKAARLTLTAVEKAKIVLQRLADGEHQARNFPRVNLSSAKGEPGRKERILPLSPARRS